MQTQANGSFKAANDAFVKLLEADKDERRQAIADAYIAWGEKSIDAILSAMRYAIENEMKLLHVTPVLSFIVNAVTDAHGRHHVPKLRKIISEYFPEEWDY